MTIWVVISSRRLLLPALCLILVSAGPGHRAVAQAPESNSSIATHPPRPQPETDLQSIQTLISRGHLQEALGRLQPLLAADPVPPGAHRLQGMALYSAGKLPEADQSFAAALTQDPQDRKSIQMRGITLFRLGRAAAAIPLLESLRSNTPGAASAGSDQGAPVDPAYVLALCYLDTRRYDDARGAFAQQFGFPRDSAPAYLLTARMLLRHEYIPIAQQYAQKALELSPKLPGSHTLLGETYLAGNHLEEAIQQFEAERALNPLEPSIYDRLGDAYIRGGDFSRAQQSLEEAVLLEPNATGPFILLGKALLKQGDAASAAGYLEHARQMDDQNYMTHNLLGQAYRQMGRMEDAHRETETAQKLQSASEPDFQHGPK